MNHVHLFVCLTVCPFYFPVWSVTFYHFISSHYISSHAVLEICIMKSKGVKNVFNISHKPQIFFSIHINLFAKLQGIVPYALLHYEQKIQLNDGLITTSNSLYLCIKRDSHCSKYQNLVHTIILFI